PGTEDLAPLATSGDHGLVLLEPAPFGVIGAITPVTNPTSTIICNAIGMVAAGNTVVFNAHPYAKRVSMATVRALNQAIVAAGGPPNTPPCHPQPNHQSAGRAQDLPPPRPPGAAGGRDDGEAARRTG